MAKFTERHAGPDDPIFSGKYVVSSPKSKSASTKSTGDTPKSTAGQADQKSAAKGLLDEEG